MPVDIQIIQVYTLEESPTIVRDIQLYLVHRYYNYIRSAKLAKVVKGPKFYLCRTERLSNTLK